MKKSKAILMALCAVLLVAASVMGTLAYLTSTDTVTNTFTIGKVAIKLDEAKVDVNGTPVEGEPRVQSNDYKLMPGHTYTKDPTVHVKADSEPSYIRMLVTVSDITNLAKAFPANKYPEFYSNPGNFFLLEKLVGGWDSSVWECTSISGGTYEFRYVAGADGIYTVPADADTEYVALPALFKTITIPGDVDATALANLDQVKITVVAQAIQADGFNGDVNAAWRAFSAASAPTVPTEATTPSEA